MSRVKIAGIALVFATAVFIGCVMAAFSPTPVMAQSTDTVDTLTKRIDNLEKQNKILMFAGFILGIGFVAMIATRSFSNPDKPTSTPRIPAPRQESAQPVQQVAPVVEEDGGTSIPDIIRAKGIEIVDDNGNTCAVLGLSEDGAPALNLFDAEHRMRGTFTLDADGNPCLGFYDDTEETRVWATLDQDGSPRFDLYDGASQPGIELAVDAGAGPRLSMYDKRGEPRAEVTVNLDGSPGIGLYHSDPNTTAWLTVKKNGVPAIGLINWRGETIWTVPEEAEQEYGLNEPEPESEEEV